MPKRILQKLKDASTYDEWVTAAKAWDELNGLDRWKRYEKSNRYDYAAIRRRLNALRRARKEQDNHALLFSLHEGIHGNLGGMGRVALYEKAKFGTKDLIIDYVEEVTAALTHLARPRVAGVTQQEKLEFFHRASLCFGRSAFLMSGSGTFLFYHVGVLKALWEQDLVPEVISGASGGAFVAAVLGTRKPEQVSEIFTTEFISLEADLKLILNKLLPLQKKSEKVSRYDLEEIVVKLIPDLTFEEAYEQSGLQINISITPAETHQRSRLLNAITSPNVLVREAVLASCCLPGVFAPVQLAAKNVHGEKVPYLPSRRWVDGSLSDDLPMKRLSRLYGANHFIVSQTNPIVLPFIREQKSSSGVVSTLGSTGLRTIKDWGLTAGHILQKPLKTNSYLSKLLNGYISVVSQTYTGDINIFPASKFLNPTKVLSSHSNEEILEMLEAGERATWPHLERIRIQTMISRRLWEIVKKLETPSKGNLARKSKRNAA